MRTFNSEEAYFQSERDAIAAEENRPIKLTDGRQIKLSRSIPNKFKRLSAKDNIERLKILSRKLSNDSITEVEFEEYGWRIAGN